MKDMIYFSFILFSFFSCNDKEVKTVSNQSEIRSNVSTSDNVYSASDSVYEVKSLSRKGIGTYQGDFSGNIIHISITFCDGKNVNGFTTVRGLRRNFKGEIHPSNDKGWIVSFNEPGDNSFDGKYSIVFDSDFTYGKALWSPLNNLSLESKKFNILRIQEVVKDEELSIEYANENYSIVFNPDGTCELKSYESPRNMMIEESAGKLSLGTWVKNDDLYIIKWNNKNPFNQKPTSTFRITEDESKITGESIELYADFL